MIVRILRRSAVAALIVSAPDVAQRGRVTGRGTSSGGSQRRSDPVPSRGRPQTDAVGPACRAPAESPPTCPAPAAPASPATSTTRSGYDRFLEAFGAEAGLVARPLVMRLGPRRARLRAAPARARRAARADLGVPFVPGSAGTASRAPGARPRSASCRWGHDAGGVPPRCLPSSPTAPGTFDHGTQRAVLKLSRLPPEVLARAGERLGELRCSGLMSGPRRVRTSAPSLDLG